MSALTDLQLKEEGHQLPPEIVAEENKPSLLEQARARLNKEFFEINTEMEKIIIQEIGKKLLEHGNDELYQAMLKEKYTLQECFNFIKTKAKEKAVNGVFCGSDISILYDWAREFYLVHEIKEVKPFERPKTTTDTKSKEKPQDKHLMKLDFDSEEEKEESENNNDNDFEDSETETE